MSAIDLWINPSFSTILMDMGSFLAALGLPEEAISAGRLASRLNPRDTSNFWCNSAIATAYFVAADYEAALQEATKVTRWRPEFLRGPLLWAQPRLPWSDRTRRAPQCSVASR